MKAIKKTIVVLILLLVSVLLFAQTPDVYTSLKGKKLGIITGTNFDSLTQKAFPDSEYLYFNSHVDVIQALKAGKIDSYMDDEPTVRYMQIDNPDIALYDELISADEYGIGFNKDENGKELTEAFNKFLKGYKESGLLEKMTRKWFSEESKNRNVDFENLPATNGTLTFISDGTTPPFTYISNGKNTGLEVELLTEFCRANGYAAIFELADMSARIPALVSGRADGAFGCMTITEERKQSIYFADSHYVGGTVMVKLKDNTDSLKLSDFNDKKIGVLTGTTFDILSREVFPNASFLYFQATSDQIIALKEGKIDGFLVERPIALLILGENTDLKILEEAVQSDQVGFAFSKTEKGNKLMNQFNSFLAKCQEDGTYDYLTDKWLNGKELDTAIDTKLDGRNGTLKATTNFDSIPYSYIKDNQPAGYDIELAYMFCREYGYGLSIEGMAFDSLIPSLVAGKSDISLSDFTITEERKESVYMSDPISVCDVILLIKDEEVHQTGAVGFFSGLKDSFRRNFILEDRYKLVLSGLLVTIRIAVFSAIFGTVFGFGVCMQRRSKNQILSNVAAVFIRFIQGLPVVVMLMILYYIVFKKSRMSAEVVAVMGFSINFGVYVSEMMRTSIDSVDKGQIEAAHALGFKPIKAFMKITVPQALKQMLPVYKGEFISMVKMTSVVGYIAIQDLTKVGDIIRSRTFDAFFPLIATAVIYFLISYIFVVILNRIEFGLDPRNRKNVLKGVTK